MELTVLGCGDAFGNGGRNHTSFLFSAGNERVLLDCGASTLIRLKHEKIDLEEISTIIISHFHGDHYGGIPFFLISSMFERPRVNPLSIVGPEGIEGKVYELQETMYQGTSEKISDFKISFHEYRQGAELELGDKIIKAWKVEHSPPSNPHGIRLEWKGKKVAFTGDTSWTDHLLELADETDLFICECNFLNRPSFGHLCYAEIREKLSLLNSKQVWLSHMADEVIASDEVELNRLSDGLKINL
ncbi:MAG: MBL fold metallo-hydrolase [Ekhidna sp.]|uniref:MBL fold metallo-hydrolase n=1 Tax=Ekhidna sp. TaxID=2608089 RepID=UPI0032F0479D